MQRGRVFAALFGVIVSGASITGLLGAQAISVHDHQEIELAAAARIRPFLQQSFAKGIVLDPQIDSASGAVSLRRTPAHLSELARTLGANLLGANGPCAARQAEVCKLGSSVALVAFRPAQIEGDSAIVVVDLWQRSSKQPGNLVEGSLTVVLLRIADGTWRPTGGIKAEIP
jgi:hypothetical protein